MVRRRTPHAVYDPLYHLVWSPQVPTGRVARYSATAGTGAWHRFVDAPPTGPDQVLTAAIVQERFPCMFRNSEIALDAWELFVTVKPVHAATLTATPLKLSLAEGSAASTNPLTLMPWNGLLRARVQTGGTLGNRTLTAWRGTGAARERLLHGALDDIMLICHGHCV